LLPPHLTAQIVFAVKPGDAVSVRGLKARALPLVDAASVTNFVTGATVTDNGPPSGPGRPVIETTLSGKIASVLHGKRGEAKGALLENGTVLRLPPPDAERMQSLLQPGQIVAVRGVSLVTPLGTVVDVRAIGSSPEQLTELTVPPPRGSDPKDGPKAKGRGPAEFGPASTAARTARLNPILLKAKSTGASSRQFGASRETAYESVSINQFWRSRNARPAPAGRLELFSGRCPRWIGTLPRDPSLDRAEMGRGAHRRREVDCCCCGNPGAGACRSAG
jgi:hypothetical protein